MVNAQDSLLWPGNGGYAVFLSLDTLALTFQPFLCTFWGTSISEQPTRVLDFVLHQNYPNPFNPTTLIRYQIPQAHHVTMTLYDVLGQKVRTIVDEEKEAGYHETTVDASGLASGVYMYRIEAGKFVSVRKLVILR